MIQRPATARSALGAAAELEVSPSGQNISEITTRFASAMPSSCCDDCAEPCGPPRVTGAAGLAAAAIGAATPRSPGSRAGDFLNVPNSLDPGRSAHALSILFGAAPWPSPEIDWVGSRVHGAFGTLSPGPLTRPPTLRLVGRPTLRKDWASRGWILPGEGLAQVVDVYFFRSPSVSCRF